MVTNFQQTAHDGDMLLRLAVLLRLSDSANVAVQTPTFQQLSSGVAQVLMDPQNHPKYLKIMREVESEYKLAAEAKQNEQHS